MDGGWGGADRHGDKIASGLSDCDCKFNLQDSTLSFFIFGPGPRQTIHKAWDPAQV